jgi:hypothetical protein
VLLRDNGHFLPLPFLPTHSVELQVLQDLGRLFRMVGGCGLSVVVMGGSTDNVPNTGGLTAAVRIGSSGGTGNWMAVSREVGASIGDKGASVSEPASDTTS